MAGLGRKTFAAGEVLTAANVMGYLQDQAVMNFAGTAARGSAIGSAVSEGMVSYLADTNRIEVYTGSSWQQVFPRQTGSILQVVQTFKNDTASTNSTFFVDIPGMSVSITPSSTSSKILTLLTIGVVGINAAGVAAKFNLLRDATNIANPSGGANLSTTPHYMNNATSNAPITIAYLDSPATTSSVTYKYQYCTNNAAGSIFINRLQADAGFTGIATLTAFEVAG